MGDEPMERLVRSLKDDLDAVVAERDRLQATTETLSKRVDGYRTKLGQIAVDRDRLRAALQDALDVLRPLAGLVCDVDVLLVADLHRIITAALDERAEVTDG